MMPYKIAALALATLAPLPSLALADVPVRPATSAAEVVAHGGGCRKSSPPGRCCHLEKRVGVVHCH